MVQIRMTLGHLPRDVFESTLDWNKPPTKVSIARAPEFRRDISRIIVHQEVAVMGSKWKTQRGRLCAGFELRPWRCPEDCNLETVLR